VRSLLKNHWIYLISWIAWFIALWFLSSRPLQGPQISSGLPIDKILHWGYFGIGSAIATFCLLAKKKTDRVPPQYFEVLMIAGITMGLLDEWHQSWYEFRSGNDLGDFIADCLGTYCGIKAAPFAWRFAFCR